jgi:hypothetical protein
VGQDIVGGADETTAGVAKLYNETGSNADEAITQSAATVAIEGAKTEAREDLTKAVTGTPTDEKGSTTLPSTLSETVWAKLQTARNNLKSLFASLTAHISDKSNPHGVTKAQAELGDVDNTSDACKPVSAAQQAAIDAVVNSLTTWRSVEMTAGEGVTLNASFAKHNPALKRFWVHFERLYIKNPANAKKIVNFQDFPAGGLSNFRRGLFYMIINGVRCAYSGDCDTTGINMYIIGAPQTTADTTYISYGDCFYEWRY